MLAGSSRALRSGRVLRVQTAYLVGSSRALRSGRVLCDPGQAAFLLCLGKCVGEPSGTPAGSVILSSAPGGSSRRGHLFPGPHVACPMPGPQGLHTVGVHTLGVQ